MTLNKEILKIRFINFAKILKNIYNKLSFLHIILENKKEKLHINNKKFNS